MRRLRLTLVIEISQLRAWHQSCSAARPMRKTDTFQRCRHSRYYEASAVYQVVSKTLQGFMLLAPDRDGELRDLVAGVIGQAQLNYPTIRLFAAAFLSNHFHLMLAGDPRAIVDF